MSPIQYTSFVLIYVICVPSFSLVLGRTIICPTVGKINHLFVLPIIRSTLEICPTADAL